MTTLRRNIARSIHGDHRQWSSGQWRCARCCQVVARCDNVPGWTLDIFLLKLSQDRKQGADCGLLAREFLEQFLCTYPLFPAISGGWWQSRCSHLHYTQQSPAVISHVTSQHLLNPENSLGMWNIFISSVSCLCCRMRSIITGTGDGAFLHGRKLAEVPRHRHQ